MAKPRAIPRFLTRRGHDLTVEDERGRRHQVTIEKVDAEPDDGVRVTKDDGAFAFGYCKSCDWTGPARRAREKARKDATAHQDDCPKKGKVRIGVSDDDLR
ncbi:hypothetical protein DFJ68_2474 [Terracoccus luteus]|uniref:Uncharacterized protein n=1 Tax=Terracoccus luteus TaxID=53356 RepID=A0A495Y0B0_9MICO|nr:hypothetical protein [Terracoccus luteus]RKT79019.1 hypothetical protein DFJ68_2474 [Terracoccus luteus]